MARRGIAAFALGLVSRSLVLRIVAAGLTTLAAWPAVAVAKDAEPDPDAQPERVTCAAADEVFDLLCEAYELLTTSFVDPVRDSALAAAAAAGVRQAPLVPRGEETVPACALPAPAFEEVCAEIDKVADTAGAVWAATAAMVASVGEPNTFLLDPQRYRLVTSGLEGGTPFVGLGLSMGLLEGDSPCAALSATCRMVVWRVVPNSPASRAGVQADDVVLELDGPLVPGPNCGLAHWFRFPRGAVAAVKVERDGAVLDFSIEADEMVLPTVSRRTVGDIGYIAIDSFTASADERVAEELRAVLDSEASALVLDLRDNPGGYLETVLNMAGLFLKDRHLVAQEVSQRQTLEHLVSGHGAAPDPAVLPIVVLVDGSSASASELLTLALRDHGRATIVGLTTYGKNTAQITQAVTSDDGSVVGAIRVTVARWLSPRGVSAAGGIEPDVAVDLSSCLHTIGLVRQAAAAAQLPDAELADISRLGVHVEHARALDAAGVLDGTECQPGLFCGHEPVTRWQAAVWLARVVDGDEPSAVESSRFADVDPELWWAAHVERIAELGITVGCSRAPARFCGDQPVTRAQMASLLTRAFALPAAVPQGFADTDDSGHAADIDALFAAGVTQGCGLEPRRFCPHEFTSRAEMATLLARAAKPLTEQPASIAAVR